MIFKWLFLSIVLDVLGCTEKMFKLPRKGYFIEETKKKVQQLYCNWNPRVLGHLSCSYSWFLFSSYFAFSSFSNFYFISILLDFALFPFFWGVPGFLGGVPGFLGVFLVFLGVFRVFWGCSRFSGVPDCSVMFRCSWKYYMPSLCACFYPSGIIQSSLFR